MDIHVIILSAIDRNLFTGEHYPLFEQVGKFMQKFNLNFGIEINSQFVISYLFNS